MKWVKIKKIEKYNKTLPFYDISCENEPHNFFANNILVHNCKFCCVHTLWTRKWRSQNVHKVMESLDKLYSMGARYIVFYDDNFLLDVDRGKAILNEIISRKKDGRYKGVKFLVEEGMQVKHAQDEELVRMMIDAGFDDIKIGLETANKDILKNIAKPTNLSEFENAVSVFKKFNYKPKTFYIIGFDGETVESIFKNMMYMSKFDIIFRINTLNILPRTEMYSDYIAKRYIDDSYDWRLSTFFTIPTKELSWKDIKSLKAILKGINWSNSIGIDCLGDTIEDISRKLINNKYVLTVDTDKLTLVGHMFNYSEKAMFLKLIALRHGMVNFSIKRTDKNTLILTRKEDSDMFLNKLLTVLRKEDRMIGNPKNKKSKIQHTLDLYEPRKK